MLGIHSGLGPAGWGTIHTEMRCAKVWGEEKLAGVMDFLLIARV